MDGLSIFFSSISAVSVIVGLVVIVRRSGSNSGATAITLKNVDENVAKLVKGHDILMEKINSIEIRNAGKDEEMAAHKECLKKVEGKVEEHDDKINMLNGAVDFIKDKLVVVQKQ